MSDVVDPRVVLTPPTANIISGANFASHPVAMRPPSLGSDLKLWCFPRLPGPTINLVNGQALTDISGAAGSPAAGPPVYRTAWVDLFGQGIGIETGVVDALNGTLIAVARAPGQSANPNGRASASIIDNYQPNGCQMVLYNYATEFDFWVTGPMNDIGTYHMTLTGGACNNWGFYAITWQSGVGMAAYALTDGRTYVHLSTTNHALGTNTFKLGTNPAGAASGSTSESSMAFAAILTGNTASASLSSDQINQIRSVLQLALAPDGMIF